VILAMRHTGINVTDMGRALGFYRDLLGLEVHESRTEYGPYIDALTGLDDVCLDWVKVRSPDGLLVELVQNHGPYRRKPQPRDYATIGCNHLCFTVQTDPPGRVKNMACLDPDGTIIELVEEL
jgi:catechol 2,3-dioxygenase-like lactoylglutathione lyase family enzyme